MPFRIVVRSEGAEVTLEIHGWLRAPEIEVFERAFARCGGSGRAGRSRSAFRTTSPC
jgi:hypothetical protein